MKSWFFSLLLSISPFALIFAQNVLVSGLTCEHRTDPVGIDVAVPRLSWQTSTAQRNWKQSFWQVQVATDDDFDSKSLVWDSGKNPGDGSVLQPYGGKSLQSGQRYYWRVKVWDDQDEPSRWSAVAFWETALLSNTAWKAQWIEPERDTAPERFAPASLLRKTFNVRKKISSARAYVTARGYYELYLNGKKAGDELLTPGWTVYFSRHQYQTFDITNLLQTGPNVAGAMLGEGWFRSTLGWGSNRAFYGKKLALLAQIQIKYTDGTDEWIITDGSWKANQDGPVRANEIYYGEDYDARKENPAWCKPGFDDRNWHAVMMSKHQSKTQLTAANSVPVKAIQTIQPKRIFKTPKGRTVVDFGQNLVGWVRLRVQGTAGQTVTIHHAEVLDRTGNFYTENLRGAEQRIRYTLRGSLTEEVYEPRFTFMGFRYIAIEGWPGTLKPEQLTAVVVHSDMKPTGTFECSDTLINKLQSNIMWGQKGNFVDVPTDCPQRDERLGWTGDAQVFARTAAYNMNVAPFFTKWLQDVAADQRPDGSVPFVVPDVLNKNRTTTTVSAGWADAAVIIPWTMYQVYADRRMLERQYPSMKAYVDYMQKRAGESLIFRGGSVFGDWLFYRPNSADASSPDAFTNFDLISTAFLAHSAHLVSQSATVLGKNDEAAKYQALYEQAKAAFVKEFMTASGRIVSESQTSYVLALHFDLLPANLRPVAMRYLTDDIKMRKNHLATGFLGTPYLCHVLSDNGETDLAYSLLLQKSYPSWLYPVMSGATTIWERWDGQRPDSTFQDKSMNSFNHYAYGAIGDWMYQCAAGLRLGQPGYRRSIIHPLFTDQFSYVKTSYDSYYGKISTAWERTDGKITLQVTIPANTTATIKIPVKDPAAVTESGKPLSEAVGVHIGAMEGKLLNIDVGSGSYVFVF
jgi:alpha-L-rhamnosidase